MHWMQGGREQFVCHTTIFVKEVLVGEHYTIIWIFSCAAKIIALNFSTVTVDVHVVPETGTTSNYFKCAYTCTKTFCSGLDLHNQDANMAIASKAIPVGVMVLMLVEVDLLEIHYRLTLRFPGFFVHVWALHIASCQAFVLAMPVCFMQFLH